MWAQRPPGRGNCVPSQVHVKQEAVINKFAFDASEEENEGDWDLLKVNRPIPNVASNEQKVRLCRFPELGRRIGVTVRGDVTSLIELVENGFCTPDIKDGLEGEAVDMLSKMVSRKKHLPAHKIRRTSLRVGLSTCAFTGRSRRKRLAGGSVVQIRQQRARHRLLEIKQLALC